jgi:Na+-transporting NADH:ubiquinone oxidoreductase subunit NqrB
MMFFRRILTYRLALYYLSAIMLAALALSAAGIVHQSVVNLAFSAGVALLVCLCVNWAFARAFGAASNWESVAISALIIALIITPIAPSDLAGVVFLVLVSAWAMASKYMVATRKRHLFNPAAFGAALIGIGLHRSVSWWVGDYPLLLPVIVLGGALMLSRLRYYGMVAAYAVVVLAITIAYGDFSSLAGIERSLSMMGIHSMFGFFGLVMLTEPRTAPVSQWRQIAYGALVGLLFSPYTHVGSYYFTPEVAILCGNLFVFFSNRRRIQRWAEAFA